MIKVTIIGDKTVKGSLDRKAKLAREKVKAAVRSGGLIISNEAKENRVPVRTGNLKRSIHPEPIEVGGGAISVQIGTNVDYARSIEFGGSKRAPDGYLRISLDTKGDDAIREVKGAIKQLFP